MLINTDYFEFCEDFTNLQHYNLQEITQLVFPDAPFSRVHENKETPANIRDLMFCPWCKATPSSIQRIGEKRASHHVYCCSSLYCYECHNSWYLCAECSVSEIYPLVHGKGGSGRTACHRRKKNFMEHLKWHKDQISRILDTETQGMAVADGIDDEQMNFDATDGMEDDLSLRHDIIHERQVNVSVNNIRCIFDTAEMCHVGEFMIHELNGRGSRHIVQQSVMGSSLSSTTKEISSNDSLLFMLLLSIGINMSREERNKFAMMISLIQKKVEEETLIAQGTLSSYHARIPLPIVSYDMRKIFESGKQQFTNYMPLPTIVSPIPGYATVSLTKTLQVLYSRGNGWDNKCLFHRSATYSIERSSRSILEGDIAKKKIEAISNNVLDIERNITIIQPIVAWSDSADINKVKNNRSSIKVHNIYIPHEDGQSPHCVFPLAIGSGRSAHETYRTRMFAEIDMIHQAPVPCFDMLTSQVCQVRFFMLAVVQDRPEHCEFTGTIGHNGKFGALPGYSFPRSITVGSLEGIVTLKDLASCHQCYTKRINNLCGREPLQQTEDDVICGNCYDWDITCVEFKRPPKMPKDIPDTYFVLGHGRNNEVMKSKVVTFGSIKSCLQYIHNKTYSREWTDFSKTVQSFASFECVNGALAKKVYDAAKNLRKLHIQQEGRTRSELQPMDQSILPRALLSPNLSMDQCMVGIMHTFFLNGGKKVITLIQDVFKKEKMGTLFLTKSKIIFRDLRTLSLSWIMAWPFGSTAEKPMAPWVSENYVAYYQVCKCHMSLLCERLILKGKQSVVDSLKLLTSIWHRLLSIVMQSKAPSERDIVMVADLSKVFLSRYHAMEKYLERPPKDWDLQNASCHLMLLLLPDYMRTFGCLRNYWEGGHLGERSITKLKKSLPHGAHLDGSVRTAIRRYFIDVVLNQLMEREYFGVLPTNRNSTVTDRNIDYALEEDDCPYENAVNNNENCTNQSYDRYRRFRVYKSLASFKLAVTERTPFALVFVETTSNFYVITWESGHNGRQRILHRIDFCNGEVIEGTYVLDPKHILQSISICAQNTEVNEVPLVFDHTLVAKSIACAALPYTTVSLNNQNVSSANTYYFVRTERHLELRHVMEGIPRFSYPTLYMAAGGGRET